jgi:hypothetical protein
MASNSWVCVYTLLLAKISAPMDWRDNLHVTCLQCGRRKATVQQWGYAIRFYPPVSPLILNGRNISFVNSVKYLGVIFDTRVTWRFHTEMIEA